MADIDDDEEFASNFLDSMLEVEMTEEDGELDIPKNEDLPANSRNLPPIPTFDLQSHTLSYKGTNKNSLVQVGVSHVSPLKSSKVFPISSPLQKSEIHPTLPVYGKTTITVSTPITDAKSNPTVPKIGVKPNIKNSSSLFKKTFLSAEFHKEVFRPEYVKNVFVKKDSPCDTLQLKKEEMEYYYTCFQDVSKVQYCRLHCTICDDHLGCSVSVEKKLMVHKMLKVITCKPCSEFYGDGNFPCDTGDNCEIYCRWCGQGGALVCCSFCPKVFCKKCVKQNFGISFLRSIQKSSDWACFCCAQKPLWPHQAICKALIEYIKKKKTDPVSSQNDTTICCNISILNKKKFKKLEEPKVLVTQRQVGINTGVRTPVLQINQKNNMIMPTKNLNKGEQSILGSNVKLKSDEEKKLNTLITNLKPEINKTLSSRSLLANSNILKNLILSSPKKSSSSLPSPQFIHSPVIHGETIITPPGSRMVQSANNIFKNSCASVKVLLPSQTSNLDLSKIPTAKVPRDVKGLILKITSPDNKIQYIKLMPDGNMCNSIRNLSMHNCSNIGSTTFVEENLEDSFRLSNMLYTKLSDLKEKIASKKNLVDSSVVISSTNKLHLIYEKTVELLKELDRTLLEKYEIYKTTKKGALNADNPAYEDKTSSEENPQVIKRPKFSNSNKKLLPSDDSDVEILDVSDAFYRSKTKSNIKKVIRGNTLNGSSQFVSGNTKEKNKVGESSDEFLKSSKNLKKPAKRKRIIKKKKDKKIKLSRLNGGKTTSVNSGVLIDDMSSNQIAEIDKLNEKNLENIIEKTGLEVINVKET